MCRAVWRLLSRTASPGLQLQFFLLLLQLLQCVHTSGFFELQILEMSNYRMELASGKCCGGQYRPSPAAPCGSPCRTRFRLCLKEYQTNVINGLCSFGNVTSDVMGTDSFTLSDPNAGSISLPFSFRWTRAFTLILQAFDDFPPSDQDESNLIEEATYSGLVEPSTDWNTLKFTGPSASITYRIRVQCGLNHYNTTCTTFCKPRDDTFGHYTCGKSGEKQCLPGWHGDTCDKPVCKPGCHPHYGRCERSGECECRLGWRGELCDQCDPYPGCKHGYCNGSKWECICDTNWGGILCDQDLNTCGTREPCQHGGTCENTAPDDYKCTCAEGFSGTNCEKIDNPCALAPCKHGGTCTETSEDKFQCSCAAGWTGENCEIDIDECMSSPCQNNGACVDQVNGFKCNCTSAWEGDLCQRDRDECATDSPCINSIACTNLIGGYSCRCVAGWTGQNCEVNINDCNGQCQHGATCIDLVNEYHCACQPGYTDRNCATDIDECVSSPCRNGGECVDMVNGYMCICRVGFTGINCEESREYCTPDPCENNAPCYKTQDDYYCHCREGWMGKNCSQQKMCANCEDSCIGGASANTSTACSGHGTCHWSSTGYHCVCDPGFGGKSCHENINDCKYNQCQNGGTCVDKINSFRCICREGWTGELCNINIDECSLNPCKNNGSCIDGVADFSCTCKDGWKGKTCNLKDSHCDYSTCRNGGTCQDLGSTFICRCPPQWGGTACHIARMPACRSNPCLNGGTCVNTGDYYSCICKEGYEGHHCETDIDECASQPCFNGGKCIDGLNWFMCECATGFGGRDCRINVNECASGPCAHGATCIDNEAGFRCLCPPGKFGLTCDESNTDIDSDLDLPVAEEGSLTSGGACVWRGQYFAANTTWAKGCNICACGRNGPKCTTLWCGLRNCMQRSPPAKACRSNEVCVPVSAKMCLRPPCEPMGFCRVIEGKNVAPPAVPVPPNCEPNQAQLSSTCARLSLVVERSRLIRGASVEKLCSALRRALASAHSGSSSPPRVPIVLLCDLKDMFNDTVEVTISTPDESGAEAIQESARILGDYESRKQSNYTSVVEVKVETALASTENTSSTLVALLSCFIILLTCMTALVLAYFYQRRRTRALSGLSLNERNHEDEKSNNLQNEENFRRYANPLKEEMKPCPQAPSPDDLKRGDSCGEALHMITSPGTSHGRLLLYKAQNADMRNNTATLQNSSHKDFNKRSIIGSTETLRHAPDCPAASAEMLTVIV